MSTFWLCCLAFFMKSIIFAGMKHVYLAVIFWGLLFWLRPQIAQAQRHVVLSSRIASLQVVAGNHWLSMPVTSIDGDPINISFDDMTHTYHRYVYQLTHCEADWTPTQGLFASDYLEGFNGMMTIEDYEQSLNTTHLYTHYRLTIPNENCRVKIGGNYKLTVYDEEENEPVFEACFMIVEPKLSVSLGVSTNTDIDINGRHQQVGMAIKYDGLRVTQPEKQLKTVVLQNGRWDNAVWNVAPDFQSASGMEWRHKRELVFEGGNEYRKFEMLDLNHTTMGVEDIKWDGNSFHAYLFVDEPRPGYVYDESANGSFYVRNSDNQENDITSDYAWVHFRLCADRQEGEVYLNGDWTYDSFLPQWRMEYDEQEHVYHAAVLLKQGYYSYQYLVLRADGTTLPVYSEGNFFQTVNQYQALVYYRGIGERTDRLVGYKEVIRTE